MSFQTPDLFAALTGSSRYLNFCHAGRDTCAPGYTYGPTVRAFYLIHYVTSGKGSYSIGGVSYPVERGQAFLIPPNESTIYSADEKDPWSYSFFAFDGKMAKELVDRTGFADSYVLTLNDDSICDIIHETAEALNEGKILNSDIYALGRLLAMIRYFIDSKGESRHQDKNMNNYVLLALNYIQYNYFNEITVASIADMLAINRSYFFRIFKAETGLSPIEYLNNYRIMKAKQLLLESTMPVSQIAIASGFTTPSAFYRMFNLKFGMSPSQYRKEYNKNPFDQPGFC
ncbi:MAG: helix-turn-helix domain-containing protein [Ruminococcaceae bacterium]|nr:helix-turn-helix domain-containing protein [Oscillospiraceae bacterium]